MGDKQVNGIEAFNEYSAVNRIGIERIFCG